ncbi:hypothetical protein GOV09_03815 [Candidatus Woesearchaeota archaeon]|nr:hypothetical protein [Candidatus Woesearchaeota archaeon]
MQELIEKEEIVELDLNKPWPAESKQDIEFLTERARKSVRPFIEVIE